MLPPIYATLLASSAVTSIIGSAPARAYRHNSVPTTVAAPYVSWFFIGIDPENTLSEVPGMDRVAVQVNCWHATDGGVEALARAVRDAIEPHAHVTQINLDARDAQTRLYQIALQADWFLSR
jgi:Protein of unknown function (DUF3168)